jgi:hypothetical protein
MSVRVRKLVTYKETVDFETTFGPELARPITRVVVAAVIKNPFAGQWAEDLEVLMRAGEELGGSLMAEAKRVLPNPVEAYGKGGVVGELGEVEHVAAVLHPRFGGPTRDAVGGVSILPSVKKRGPTGAIIDIPIHHIKAMRIRSHFDSVEFRVADAPLADEILIALAVADGGRPHHRVGGLTEADAVGEDGVV